MAPSVNMKVVLVLFALCAAAWADYKSYDGYKVYQVVPTTPNEMKALRIFEHTSYVDFWVEPKMLNAPSTVMVQPELQNMFESFMRMNGVTFSTLIEDVQNTVAEERTRQQKAAREGTGRLSFTAYNTYTTIQTYLTELQAQYPNLVTLDRSAASYEGRAMFMAKISANPNANNPVIFIDGGIHAREWISPAVVTYIIQELVENESNRYMIENVDWYIIPVLNPDGYAYSHSSERFWRKTRSRGRLCYGVDANRNFDFHWMETGASSNECSETYAGTSGFSELETQFLRDQILAYKNTVKLYLTFHSYGNYLLYPWGWTSALPDNADELHSLAVKVDNAIASVDGTRYTIGSSTNVLYAAAGGSDDWVKGVGGVALSYTIELPGGGSQGFDLPASRILPVCIETFEGVKVYYQEIAKTYAKFE